MGSAHLRGICFAQSPNVFDEFLDTLCCDRTAEFRHQAASVSDRFNEVLICMCLLPGWISEIYDIRGAIWTVSLSFSPVTARAADSPERCGRSSSWVFGAFCLCRFRSSGRVDGALWRGCMVTRCPYLCGNRWLGAACLAQDGGKGKSVEPASAFSFRFFSRNIR